MIGRRPSPVTVANEKVPIALACRLVGIDVDTDAAYGKSVKLRCPFGPVWHSDGGLEPSFRVYPDSNTAYCFACRMHFTPAKLVAVAFDIDQRSAAAELMDRAGLRPLDPREAWQRALSYEPPPDTAMLAEALKTYCARTHPDWFDVQFDPAVASVLAGCLDLLSRVRTQPEARQWLAGCKTVMGRVLTRTTVDRRLPRS